MEDQLLAQFASPCKRHKAGKEGSLAGFMSPPAKPVLPKSLAAGSSTCTPRAHKSLGFTAPATPGTFSSAAMPGHVASGEGGELSGASVLRDVLNALHVTVPLVKSRGQLTTFNNLSQPIQNMTGKSLKVQHLQQIKHLLPDAFAWQHVMTSSSSSGASSRQEQQLVISLPDRQTKGASGSKEHLDVLMRKLQAHASGKDTSAIPLAALPAPAPKPVRDSTPNRPRNVDFPSTPLTNGPIRPTQQQSPDFSLGTPGAFKAPSNRGAAPQSFTFSPPIRRPAQTLSLLPASSPLARESKETASGPTTSMFEPQNSVKVRRLQFNAPAKEEESQAATVSSSTKIKGLKFEPGAGVLELLKEATNKENIQQVHANKEEMAFNRQISLLPATFDVLRSIFGDKGPCLKSKDELLTLMRQKSTSSSGLSQEDTQKQLDLVVRLVPGWLIELNTPCLGLASLGKPGSISVRLDRRLSWAAAHAKLLAAAEQAKLERPQVKTACEEEAALEQQEAEAAAAAEPVAASVTAEQASEDVTAKDEQGEEEVVVDRLSEKRAEVALGVSAPVPNFSLGWSADSGSRGAKGALRSSRLGQQQRPTKVEGPMPAAVGKRPRCSDVPQRPPQRKVSAEAAELLGLSGSTPAGNGAGALLNCLAFRGPRKS